MTIAIGILAKDGIVLASDTQETSGYIKTEGSKILVGVGLPGSDREPWGLAITGAGSAAYLDSFSQETFGAFWSGTKSRRTRRRPNSKRG